MHACNKNLLQWDIYGQPYTLLKYINKYKHKVVENSKRPGKGGITHCMILAMENEHANFS